MNTLKMDYKGLTCTKLNLNCFEKTEERLQKLKKKKSDPTKLSSKHECSIVANTRLAKLPT